MNTYLAGCDILGAGASGPSGARYTDKPTVRAVQTKLRERGFFPKQYTIDGVYGNDTDSAIYNFTGSYGPAYHGPPDDALLAKLGIPKMSAAAKEVSFSDAEADSMIVQAKTATTPAQVQVVLAKVEEKAKDAPPEVKKEIAEAKKAASEAKTPEQMEKAKEKAVGIVGKMKKGMPAWQIALIASGSAVGLGLAFWLVARQRAVRAS